MAARRQIDFIWHPGALADNNNVVASPMHTAQLTCNWTLFLSSLAASRIKIVPGWPPVTGASLSVLCMCHATCGHMEQSVSDWKQRNSVQLAASCLLCNFACPGSHSGVKLSVFGKHAARVIFRAKQIMTLFSKIKDSLKHII